MIIIYNLSGLFVGFAGLFIGLLATGLSGSLTAGLVTVAAAWFGLSVWWRNGTTARGLKRPWPALFFIPLPLLAIPAAVLALPMLLVELSARNPLNDPRTKLFEADEKMLDAAPATGDARLSQTMLEAIRGLAVKKAGAEEFSVFTRRKPDRVLVLMKAPNLMSYTDGARKQLVEIVMATLQGDEQSKGKPAYIGIKGKFTFGAIRKPPDVVEISSIVSKSLLYEFYDDQMPAPQADQAGQSGQNTDASSSNAASDAIRDRDEGFVSTIDVSTLSGQPAWKPYAPGIDTAEVSLKIPPNTPGNADRLILYVPHGQHRRHSLGCVFIAPSGAPIFAGNSQAEGDRAEHVPYVKAGYAVVAIDIDGEFDRSDESVANIQSTYAQFKAAGGGVVNGKNAVEYVLAKLPEIDPARLYAAGHSSAATWALLFAEHESRIQGCIAYAPEADLIGQDPRKKAAREELLPDIARLSPQESVERLKCPVFIFHAENDTVIPIGSTRRFVVLLKQTNRNVAFHSVPSGDHVLSMLVEGIPRGIRWLQSLPAEARAAANGQDRPVAAKSRAAPLRHAAAPHASPRPDPAVVRPSVPFGGNQERIFGGRFGSQFRDLAPPKGMLAGFEVGLGKWGRNDIVSALRPIYADEHGKEVLGAQHGVVNGQTIRVMAKEGYAVGAITAKSMAAIDGFSLTFMKIDQERLDPSDQYQSDWVGGMGGSPETTVGGNGSPALGIIGYSNDKDCTAVGLIFAPAKGG